MQLKGCVRRDTRQRISVLDRRLDRKWTFLQPIKEDIEPALVDMNVLITKAIVSHQLTAAEIGGDGSATHSIDHKLAMPQFHIRDPRRLWDIDGVFHRSGAIGKSVTRRWWGRGFNIHCVGPRIHANGDAI